MKTRAEMRATLDYLDRRDAVGAELLQNCADAQAWMNEVWSTRHRRGLREVLDARANAREREQVWSNFQAETHRLTQEAGLL